jgi:hypothetical protein
MSCCNKPPNGGSNDMGLALKVLFGLLIFIFLLAFIFG